MGKAEVDAFFADDPAPAAPVAPAPTSKVDAFFASDRAPSQESAALDPGELTRLGGDLWQTVYRGRKDEGENEDDAVKAANASVEALRAIGPDADKARVRDALAAHVGPDTLDKTMTRAFGQRVYAAPLAEPNRAARDDARRASEQEFRRATGVESIPDAWTKGAGDTGPRMATEDEVKPWLQRTKAAAENIAAGVLTAGTLPLISKVAEWSGYAPILPDAPTPLDIPRTVGDVLNDRDVATLAGVDLDKKTIDPNTGLPGIVTGLVAKTPIPDAVDYVKIPQAVAALADSMKARGVPVPDVDAQTWVRFWDDARDYEAFDAANAAYYETGDRSKVDAIAFDQLPATLRGERPNAAMAKAAAESGDPDFAPLLQYADADEGFYQKQVEKLPIGALARLQTEVAPTFAELEQAFKARADAKKWRGDDQGQAALRLMSAGMLAPVGDGKALVVVPSKAAEAARLANTVWSGLMNVDLGVGGGDTIGEKVAGLPTVLPRAALYLAEEAGIESAGTLRDRIEGSRLPTARGLETMATNPAFDDAMRFLGLATSQDYDVLDDPDSTWLSRTLADIADPEYGARHWADFLRRGGESESSTAMKAAEFADIAEQFVIPAEELALAPLTRSVAALNRARAAAYVARETGASSREARALALDAMRPRAYLDRDVIESANERLTRTALEGVANGTLDPDKVSPNVKRQVGEILNRTIGYSEDDVAKMWDDLRDRRMRILDTAKDIEMSGGPRTRELRASNEYRDTMRGLDDLVRTQNLSPQDRDVMRAFLEASAFSAYDRGAVGSPEDYFARHSWERGVEGEVLPEGTLLSGSAKTITLDGSDKQYRVTADGPEWMSPQGWRPVRNVDIASRLREIADGRPRVTVAPSAPEPAPIPESYRITHRPTPTGMPAHDLLATGGEWSVPPDIMAHPERYTGFPANLRSFWPTIVKAQGNPNATITVYRALPPEFSAINDGDWVTPSLEYARTHLASNGEPGWRIVAAKVPADSIRFAGDDLMEWGYFGDQAQATPVAAPLRSESPGTVHGSIEAAPTPRPDVNPQGFYSALRRAVEGLKGDRFTADQLRATLKNTPGVKADEIEWTGLDRFLAEHPKPTKGEVLDWLDENAVVVEEKVLGTTPEDAAWQAKYDAARERLSAANEALKERSRSRPSRARGDFSDLLDPTPAEDEVLWDEHSAALRAVSALDAVRPNKVDTHYGSYQLPGGSAYREILFKVPVAEDASANLYNADIRQRGGRWFVYDTRTDRPMDGFGEYATRAEAQAASEERLTTYQPPTYQAPHFGDEGENLLAHTRVSDRVGPNGERILHVEEIQSDWHQAGREKGYKSTSAESVDEWLSAHSASGTGRQGVPDEDGRTGYFFTVDGVRRYLPNIPNERGHISEADAARRAFAESEIARFRVPDAPFAKNWHELVLKRILRMAADGGYDGVSWTTGVQQVKRYEDATRAAVDEIKYAKNAAGNVEVIGLKNGTETYRDTLPPEKLPDVLGKEIARKIVDSPDASGSLTGPDLTVGGEGMKGFYDRMIPQFLDKYAKKWGARPVDTSIVTAPGESAPVHYLPIPDNMRASILTEGQPLFSRKGGVTRGSISPGTPDTVNVPNPDYAAWEARVNALSAEVDALKAVPTPEPTEIPNPAFPEAVKRVHATDAEIRDLKQQASRAFGVNPAWTAWEAEIPNLANDPVALGRHMAAQPPKSAQHVNNALIAAKEAELATLRANIPPRTLVEAPPVDDVLNAKAEALVRLRRFKIPKEVPKPSDVSRWLIKLFRTGDVKTAFHEGTHLLDLMMGEEWTRKAAEALNFTPEQIDAAFAGDQPMMVRIREAIAEAGTRALRGTLRPGSKLGNVFEDVRDVMGDVWRRVRNEPAITTPKFKRFFDQTFRPTNGTMELAAKIVDERTPASRFGRVVQGGTAADEIAEALPARIGAAKQATNTIRGDAEMRQALGLTNDMDEIPVRDILAKALAYVGTEKLRRTWGMGDLTGLTARTVVPTARAHRVKQEVAAYRAAVLGGAPPRPKVVDGVEVFELTPTQARGMRRMLDELANQPIAATLPDRLLEPGADLTRMTPEEWESVVTHQLEMRAGAGAWRDRVAEAAQVSGAQRLIDLTVTTAEHSDLTKIPDAIRNIREKFVVDTPGSNYTTNPAVIEMFAAFARDIGSAPGRVARRIQEIQRKGKGWREAFREIGAGIPPEVVPVTALEDLRGAARVVSATDVAEVTERVPEISRLFAASPIDSVPQMAQEQRALSILDSIGARMGGAEPPPPDVQFAPEVNPDAAFGSFEQSAARFSDALADAGVSPAQAADAMATVQEGIRRRVAAVEDLGADILVTFAGSKDRAILNGINDPAVRSAYMQEAYANWYTGDWERIFRDVTTDQHKVFQSPKYDQGTAILNVLVRLETRRVFGSLARRMAEAGVGGDVARVLEAGNRYDRPYVFGSLTETGTPGDVSITGQRYIAEVAGYIESIAGGHETTVFRPELPDGTREATSVARGERTAGGAVNLAAYADAQRILQQFGFQPFKGAAWSEVDLPGGAKVMLPDVWKDPIQKVLDEVAPMGGAYGTDGPKLGAFVPGTEQPATIQVQAANLAIRTLFNSYGYAMGMLKTGLTTGMGPLIRPGFFVGNAFGGLFQLYQGVGAVNTLKIITRPLLPTDEGATIRRVLARMWRDGEGAFGRTTLAPAESGFFDPVGRWWSDQRVAASANRAGLNSSLVKSEFTHAIIEDIRASDPTLWNRLTNNPKLGATVGAVVGFGAGGVGGAVAGGMVGATLNRRWQSFMHEGATAIDNYYRVSTYVDALRRGVPEAEAANLARRVAFDYNALTDFEKKLSRNVVLFYAYQRNAQNLFWWTMLNHPSRIMGQLRALNGVQQQTYEKDADLYAPSWGDGRFQFDFRPAFKEGHTANAMKGAVTLSPSTGIADTIGVWQSLLGISDLSAASFGELAAKVNPWIQSVPVMYSGKDPYSQRSIEGFNKIPNWLIEMDANLTGGQLKEMFNAQQVQTRNEATQDYPGAPEWVVGPGEVPGRAWWVFRQLTLAGSTMDTITAMQRADVGQSLVGEHGFVQAAVDTSRNLAPILGNESTPYVEDVGMARSGLTEWEELLGWLGFKPVQIPLREQALGRAQRVREGEIKDKIRAEKDRAERRYR